MKTINLNWQDLTEENVTKLYLYGDLDNTHDLTSQDIHKEGTSNNSDYAQVTVQLNNFYDYMTNKESPMRYANLSQIPVVQKFFTEKTHSFKEIDPDRIGTPVMVPNLDALSEGSYTIDEIQKHFYDPNDRDANIKSYGMQHMTHDPLSTDYDKRVYVFNSQAIHLGNEATFVVKPNGERLIENAAPTIASEDFDFVTKEPNKFLSKETLTNAGNDIYLKPNVDPLSIGRTVNIAYPKGDPKDGHKDNPPAYTQYIQDYAKSHGDYTQDKFENDLQRHEQEYSPVKGLTNVAPAMSSVIDNLWESNTTKFLDNQGNAIIYEKDSFAYSNYANNTNMQSYLQESDKNYHLVDRDTGKEEIIEIPHPQRENVTEQSTQSLSKEEDSNERVSSAELIESCMVSNEVVEMLARENERPVTTMIREMQESAANANESYAGRTPADDYGGMD